MDPNPSAARSRSGRSGPSNVLSSPTAEPGRLTRSYGGRTVRIHLPPGYDAERRDKYPLLLFHDGQEVFATWNADDTIDRLVADGRIPPVVAAAIDHGGERRTAEFTPTQGGRSDAGRAREYSKLVFNQILPGLADELHVRTDAAGMTMCGAALGGLVTLWLAATNPGRFGRLVLMSPAVGWDDCVILRTLKTRPLEPPPRVWLDCGKREGAEVLRDTRTLRDALRANPHLHLKYVEDEQGEAAPRAWGGRLADALTWIYGAELPLTARLRPRTESPQSGGRLAPRPRQRT